MVADFTQWRRLYMRRERDNFLASLLGIVDTSIGIFVEKYLIEALSSIAFILNLIPFRGERRSYISNH